MQEQQSALIAGLWKQAGAYLEKIREPGGAQVGDARIINVSTEWTNSHPEVTTYGRAVKKGDMFSVHVAPKTVEYKKTRVTEPYDYIDFCLRASKFEDVRDPDSIYETKQFSRLVSDPYATAENIYEKKLLAAIQRNEGDKPFGIINPSRGTMYRTMELGGNFEVIDLSGGKRTEELESVVKQVQEAEISVLQSVPAYLCYGGSNGKEYEGKYISLIPNPFVEKTPYIHAVERCPDGLRFSYVKKSWYHETMLKYDYDDGYLYPPAVVDKMLGLKNSAFFMRSSELFTSEVVSNWSYVESHRLPTLGPYSTVDFRTTKLSASYDDKYVYDVILPSVWYAKRWILREIASSLGLQVVPYDPDGPYIVNHFTISPQLSPKNAYKLYNESEIMDESAVYQWTGHEVVKGPISGDALVSGRNRDEVEMVGRILSSDTIDVYGKLTEITSRTHERYEDISYNTNKYNSLVDVLYSLEGFSLRECAKKLSVGMNDLIAYIFSRPDIFIYNGFLLLSVPEFRTSPSPSFMASIGVSVESIMRNHKTVLFVNGSEDPQVYDFLRQNGVYCTPEQFMKRVAINTRWKNGQKHKYIEYGMENEEQVNQYM